MDLDFNVINKAIASLVVILGVIPALLSMIPSRDQITTLTRKRTKIDNLIIFCFEVLDRKELKPSDNLMIEYKFNKVSGQYCDYRTILEIVKLPSRYNLIKGYCLNRGMIELSGGKLYIPKKQQDSNLYKLTFFYALYLISAFSVTLYGIHIPSELEFKIFDFNINAKISMIIGSIIPALSSILIIQKLAQRHIYMIKFSAATDSEINITDLHLTAFRYFFIGTLAYEMIKIIMNDDDLIHKRSKNSANSQ